MQCGETVFIAEVWTHVAPQQVANCRNNRQGKIKKGDEMLYLISLQTKAFYLGK